MKTLISIPILMLMLLLFSAKPEKYRDNSLVGTNDTLRVMTFNIRYDNPRDSIWVWKNRKELVVKTIRLNNPDILGLQEVLYGQLTYLQTQLPGYGSYGAGRDDGKQKGEYAAIFYKKEKYELIKGGNFWLSNTPFKPSLGWDAACIRIVTWVKLKDRKNGEVLLHFNTHFDHVGKLAQVNSARLILDSIRSIAGELPFVLTGDFNVNETSEAYTILTSNSPPLMDTRKVSESEPWGSNCTFIGFPAVFNDGNIIDFIFIPNDKFKTAGIQTGLVVKSNIYPSDHLPVSVYLISRAHD